MRFEHGKVIIRDAVKSDAWLLAEWWNDGDIMAHAGFPHGLGTTAAKVERELEHPGRLIIEYDGEPIGEMSYELYKKGAKVLCSGQIVESELAAEIGIKICVPGMRERGLGRICLSLLIAELFRLGAGEILLDTMVGNSRARHVYELIGFELLGVNDGIWVSPDGVAYSSADYRLVPEKFQDFAKENIL